MREHARTFPKPVRALWALVLALGLMGCQVGNKQDSSLKSISIRADYVQVPLGVAVTYQATGSYGDRTADVTEKVAWAVSDETKARIVTATGDTAPMGTLFPNETGTVTVKASLDGVKDTITLEIT